MKKIILASASPRRKEILGTTGLKFDICVSDYEEELSMKTLERLIEAEIKCKSTGAPSEAICSRALMTIANAASSRRRAAV